MRPSEPRTPWLQGRRRVGCIASRNTLAHGPSAGPRSRHPALDPTCQLSSRSSSSATASSASPTLAEACATALTSVPVTAITSRSSAASTSLPQLVAPGPVAARRAPRRGTPRGRSPSAADHRTPASFDALSRVDAMCSHESARRRTRSDVARGRRREGAGLQRVGEALVGDLQQRDRRLSVASPAPRVPATAVQSRYAVSASRRWQSAASVRRGEHALELRSAHDPLAHARARCLELALGHPLPDRRRIDPQLVGDLRQRQPRIGCVALLLGQSLSFAQALPPVAQLEYLTMRLS